MVNKINNKGKPVFGAINLRVDESMKIYPDLKKAKNILFWKSKTKLDKGLLKTINFYKKNIF